MSTVASARTTALWLDRLDPPVARRPGLDGDLDVDVAIVGGGFSGLWTAHYLSRLDPDRSIAVIEREFCGFGASGRNGGWAVGELAGSFEQYAKRSSPEEALRLSRLVFDAVDEIGRVADAERLDIDHVKGGTIYLARNAPQAERQRAEIDEARAHGFTEDEVRFVEPDEARSYLRGTEVRGGIFFAPTAAIDPAKLARGLADVVERRGVTVLEGTEVTATEPGTVRTTTGTVTARSVIRATEAYTRDLEGERRRLLPVYSLMIATEPLDADVIDDIAPSGRLTFADARHMVIYGQVTADRRIAFGGRGVPYLFGSRIDEANALREASHQLIHDTLVEILPQLRGAAITHRWGGVLGIPRDWVPGLAYDRASGVGHLGGYVGEGVAAANLAGRTMAELVAGHDTERTSAAWVGVRSRRWEPEPLRWLGVRASRAILGLADDKEYRTDREAKLAFRLSRLLRGA